MSSSYRTTRFTCGNDCRQEGYPGHELTIKFHHTSDTDTVAIIVDGEEWHVDEVMFFETCKLVLGACVLPVEKKDA